MEEGKNYLKNRKFLKLFMMKLMWKFFKITGQHDTWFRVICIWNHLLKMAAVIGFSFKEWFFRCQLLFLDFYHFHHVIWGMKWAKRLKTKNGQKFNMSSGPFSHDMAQLLLRSTNRSKTFLKHRENDPSEIKTYTSL